MCVWGGGGGGGGGEFEFVIEFFIDGLCKEFLSAKTIIRGLGLKSISHCKF